MTHSGSSTGKDLFWAASDIHLHPSRPSMTELFFEFLNHAIEKTEELILLGDLFDYWVGPAEFHEDEYGLVLDALSDASSSGLEINFIGGNRDFLATKDLIYRCNISHWPGGWSLTTGNERWIGIHGDTLCHMDTVYQFYRRMFGNEAIEHFVRLLPSFLKSRLIRDMRAISSEKVAAMNESGPELSPYMAKAILYSGYDHIICGHVHNPKRIQFSLDGSSKYVWILGDWMEPGNPHILTHTGTAKKLIPYP